MTTKTLERTMELYDKYTRQGMWAAKNALKDIKATTDPDEAAILLSQTEVALPIPARRGFRHVLYRKAITGLVAVSLSVTLVLPAMAHDWYTNQRNPVTGSSCCGKADCVPIPPGDIKLRNGMVQFLYPLDGKWYEIPLDQVLPSRDSQNHGCVWGKTMEGGPKLCFFAGGGV